MFREKIEVILQETLFEPSTLLETTVAEAMTKVLEIRDSILERTKKIRQKDDSITICEGQGVNQNQFLTTARMEVMTVLLSLIEQEAATPEKLQVNNTVESRFKKDFGFLKSRFFLISNTRRNP